MPKLTRSIFVVLSMMSSASVVYADGNNLLSAETSRGLALGTGSRASASSTSGAVYNPAALAMGRRYHVETAFGYEPMLQRYVATAAVADSFSSKVAAGMWFSWLQGTGDGANDHSGFDTRLALAMPILEELAIGVTGRYVSIESKADGVADLAKGFTVDASIQMNPAPWMHIAALGYNLVALDTIYAPRVVGGSLGFDLGTELSFGGDVLVDLSSYDAAKITAGGGIEYLAAGTVPIRIGYSYQQGLGVHSVTAGLGYVNENLGVDISLKQGVEQSRETALLTSFRYFVR